MTTKQQPAEDVDCERENRRRAGAAISRHVLEALGSPDELLKVQVQPLWDNHYRVNVLVGATLVSVKVAQSYFLQADGVGNILRSTPEITRQY